jgi:HlyD family secretion protein
VRFDMSSATASTDELRRALAAEEGGRVWLRRLGIVLGLVALVAVGLVVRAKNKPPPPARYLFATVSRGDVSEKVQATGAVQPLLQVNVGAQANGRVTKVPVDFNSFVKKGQLLAEIDPTLFDAQVSQTQANLLAQRAQAESARANLVATKANFDRIERLFKENLASKGELDAARGQYDVAQAQLSTSLAQAGAIQSQLTQAATNKSFTKIYSPVDGVVISRTIDPGSTVVASFQAPVLFVIAQDLRKMRVLADVDEADVGKLKENMDVEAVVDAFPGEIFKGTVQQVRFSPNNVQGVVTYSAVVEVQNPEEKLRPGMTATITVKTKESKNVLQVPNAALRFKPTPPLGPNGKPVPQPPEAPLGKGQARVHVLLSDKPGDEKEETRVVSVGVTDGVHTEVTGLDEGAKVITDESETDEKKRKGKPF